MKTPVFLIIGTVVVAIGAGIYAYTAGTSSKTNGNGNVANHNINAINANYVSVPTIKIGTGSTTVATSISNPDTSGWSNGCVTGFPCLTLPAGRSACAALGNVEVYASGTCASHPNDAPSLIMEKVSDVGTAASLIPGTTLTVSPAFQHTSVPISDTINGHAVYCLDDAQGMYCIINLGAGKRYLLQGNYYHTESAEKTMYDGALQKLLAQ